ncbi:hypothetical protein [Pseudalkalibacillus caeni]|uniref:Uncharacterized protein n=1 Tax=Exobacillus caeni TaxID=2574798 RepID=A0A5R9FB68_9BACL|nr:hypothetical protein [Pseudalkalibacillus caeni]TLS37794.1 hypothetical protein FCL54_08205 [Pseudalkalibacillus caeni]
MANRYNVTFFEDQESEASFKIDDNALSIKNLEPAERVLVDSDNMAFIYLFDGEEGYTYFGFQKDTWPMLNMMIKNDKKVYILDNENNKKELIQLKEEMEYLIENINGNANYGVDLVSAVEEVFFASA